MDITFHKKTDFLDRHWISVLERCQSLLLPFNLFLEGRLLFIYLLNVSSYTLSCVEVPDVVSLLGKRS